ncbi:MAG TPA: hypothetical protein VII08_15415 [Myxococcales bacterium]
MRIMALLAARDLHALAVDASREVFGNVDEPSPDSLPAQLGMDYQRGDACQPTGCVKQRNRVQAEESGKSLAVAGNRIGV